MDKFRLAGEVDLYGKKRNPLVLVGAMATAGVLFAGITAFRRGNTVRRNDDKTRATNERASLSSALLSPPPFPPTPLNPFDTAAAA